MKLSLITFSATNAVWFWVVTSDVKFCCWTRLEAIASNDLTILENYIYYRQIIQIAMICITLNHFFPQLLVAMFGYCSVWKQYWWLSKKRNSFQYKFHWEDVCLPHWTQEHLVKICWISGWWQWSQQPDWKHSDPLLLWLGTPVFLAVLSLLSHSLNW